MPPPTPPETIQELRRLISSAISDFKAYDVPALCSRLGLADGTAEEAFSSKFKYASSRLQAVKLATLLVIGRQLLEEVNDYPLAEQVAKIEELDEPDVTELTRRLLVAVFDKRPIATQIEDLELIKKVWPVENMPSNWAFGGAKSLLEDIFQHTVRNPEDWDNGELLRHLGVLTCSRRQLFKFLKEVTGPIAQTPQAQSTLVNEINTHLQHDGYRLVAVGKLSGAPVYEVQRVKLAPPVDDAISATLAAFNPDQIHNRWTAAVDRCSDDPQGAITLARTLLEDVCKWIIDAAGEQFAEKDDLPVLYRKLSKILRLAPDDHTEQAFKQLLGSCQQVVELLGSLRNKLGDAHSPGPKRVKPAPRHAQLAVTLSGGMATFLVETWKARQSEKAGQPSRE